MANKNRFILTEITLSQGCQTVLMTYLPDKNDPKFDDLPSEILTPGQQYYVTFTPVKKEDEDEFNAGK